MLLSKRKDKMQLDTGTSFPFEDTEQTKRRDNDHHADNAKFYAQTHRQTVWVQRNGRANRQMHGLADRQAHVGVCIHR